MAGVGEKSSSVRVGRFEIRRLMLALMLSLAVHLVGWGGYEAGKKAGLWQQLHWPKWLQRAAKIKPRPLQPAVQNSEPVMYLDVSPQQAAEAPPSAKYYSDKNSRAANPDANRDANTPKLNGRQTDVPKTQDAPRPQPARTQPGPETQLAKSQPPESPPKPVTPPGDWSRAQPQASPKQTDSPPPRPRTLNQARAQQSQLSPGLQMQQDGGVTRRAVVSSLDAKATPFGEYDKKLVEAVTQHWYDLLDSQKFAQDRTGKVTLRFQLNHDGSISHMEVLENSVGDLLGYVCQQAVLAPSPFEAWPGEMRRLVGANYREITFTFYYY